MKTLFTQSSLGRACIAAAALALSAGAVQAADPVPVKAPIFSQLDANRDGYIDVNEASASLEVSGWLASADKDKDGKLSPSEFAAARSSAGIDK
ncbi:MAG: EF-hand domain pair [Rhodocyclales bacterium]|nr:EF-hand domain pair [Rhodocyclales bacterium]